jgi:4-hydroxyproline epimerase
LFAFENDFAILFIETSGCLPMCDTGTSAQMAQLFAKGKLNIGEEFIHESFIGSKFIGKIEAETRIGNKSAIIPSIKGWTKVFGYNTIIDDDDPFAYGFQVI